MAEEDEGDACCKLSSPGPGILLPHPAGLPSPTQNPCALPSAHPSACPQGWNSSRSGAGAGEGL